MSFFRKEGEKPTQPVEEGDGDSRFPWIRPLLERLGEVEWGKHSFVVTPDPSEAEEGWVVRKLAGNHYYQIGIRSGKDQEMVFFIKTGGNTVFSRDLSREALCEALDEAYTYGPTHLVPLRKRGK